MEPAAAALGVKSSKVSSGFIKCFWVKGQLIQRHMRQVKEKQFRQIRMRKTIMRRLKWA